MENTPGSGLEKSSNGDHLHIRGEYAPTKWKPKDITGSPPHTWRIHSKTGATSLPERITSTYVENTGTNEGYILLIEDHLHIRGEYQFISC